MTNLNEITWGADCPISHIGYLPRDIPAIWPYVTGTPEIRWPRAAIESFPDAHVIRVNQAYDSVSDLDGDEFDMEAGAWTASDMIDIITTRRTRQWSTRIYGTYWSYGALTPLLATAGIRRSTFWRIADWDLSLHLAQRELYADVYAGQYASPTSNPDTFIPGTGFKLSIANADLNVLLRTDTGWEG